MSSADAWSRSYHCRQKIDLRENKKQFNSFCLFRSDSLIPCYSEDWNDRKRNNDLEDYFGLHMLLLEGASGGGGGGTEPSNSRFRHRDLDLGPSDRGWQGRRDDGSLPSPPSSSSSSVWRGELTSPFLSACWGVCNGRWELPPTAKFHSFITRMVSNSLQK